MTQDGVGAAAPCFAPLGDNRLGAAVGDLRARGWAWLPDALPPELAGLLREDALMLQHRGAMAPAGIGRAGERMLERDLRRAAAYWLDGASPAQAAFLAWCETLRAELNRRLILGLFEFEASYLFYPEGGLYERHRDSFRGARNRVLSLVAYLNEEWESGWGGELVIYASPEDQVGAALAPLGGALALLLSEEIEHEVRPTIRPRLALAGWWRVNQTTGERADPPL